MCVLNEGFTNETSSELGLTNMFVYNCLIRDECIVCLHLKLETCQVTEWHEFHVVLETEQFQNNDKLLKYAYISIAWQLSI
jgi:hypothetical protein